MSLLFPETKSQALDGQRERILRFHSDLDSRTSSMSERDKLNNYGYSLDCHERSLGSISSSLKRGLEKGSQGLKNIGRSLRIGVSRVVFPEDFKPTEKMIFDPQDKSLQRWNRFFVVTCIIAVAVDPLFFYLPVFDEQSRCLDLDRTLAITTTVLRCVTDLFYLVHMALQFRTAFIAPSSRVFGRGELVIDPLQIAKRYLSTYFIIDFLAVLPLPQVVVWFCLQKTSGLSSLIAKHALQFVVFFQYVPRFFRLYPLTSDVVKTAGVFTETAWAGAAYNLLLYMLASHVFGAWWYLLAVEREDSCWQSSCKDHNDCKPEYLYCGNWNDVGFKTWNQTSQRVFSSSCPVTGGKDVPFNFGIYTSALQMKIVASKKFLQKYFYCLWWGLQNLSTLGQGLETSKYMGEVLFSITLAVVGLILFALLIGNMQEWGQHMLLSKHYISLVFDDQAGRNETKET